MANKKFKTGVDLQSTVKISSSTPSRAMVLNASGELVNSAVTDTEIGYMSGVTSSLQTQVDSKADLVGGKIPSSQIPAVAIVEVFTAADIAARDAITIGSGDGEIQEGDVVIVTDASADAAITAGAASYIYDGSAYKLLKAGDEVLSVNGEVGTVVLDADDISDAATTNKFTNAADITKMGHISVTQAVDLDTIESDTATNNAKVSADGSVVTHSDVTDAGSGIIISAAERTNLGNQSGTNTGDEVAASTTVAGISEIATSAEINTGTDDTRTISPLGLAGSQLQTDVTANNAKVSADGLVTTHSDVTSAGSGIIISAAERTKLDGIEALATADQTGAEIKIAYEAEADTNAYDDAAVTKLGGIEALADVTDATNVAAAGATMDSDTSLAGNGYFLDEDDMVSNDATKTASQQSIKAYVDAQAAVGGNLSSGDIKETSFSGAADTATNLDVTGLAFANGTVRSFTAHLSVLVDATADLYETFNLTGIQKAAGWDMSVDSTGDDSLVSFTITAAGQVQYSKTTTAGWVSTTIKFRADTTTV